MSTRKKIANKPNNFKHGKIWIGLLHSFYVGPRSKLPRERSRETIETDVPIQTNSIPLIKKTSLRIIIESNGVSKKQMRNQHSQILQGGDFSELFGDRTCQTISNKGSASKIVVLRSLLSSKWINNINMFVNTPPCVRFNIYDSNASWPRKPIIMNKTQCSRFIV